MKASMATVSVHQSRRRWKALSAACLMTSYLDVKVITNSGNELVFYCKLYEERNPLGLDDTIMCKNRLYYEETGFIERGFRHMWGSHRPRIHSVILLRRRSRTPSSNPRRLVLCGMCLKRRSVIRQFTVQYTRWCQWLPVITLESIDNELKHIRRNAIP